MHQRYWVLRPRPDAHKQRSSCAHACLPIQGYKSTDTLCLGARKLTSNEHSRACVYRDNDANAAPGAQQFFLQFLTRYMHWSGELRLRVSTVTRRWIDGGAVADLIT
eukprot:scaffold129830_cov19-Tisochrysis_lutea.AAC.2